MGYESTYPANLTSWKLPGMATGHSQTLPKLNGGGILSLSIPIPWHEEIQRAATCAEGFTLSSAIRQREIVQASQPDAAMHTDCIMKLRRPAS